MCFLTERGIKPIAVLMPCIDRFDEYFDKRLIDETDAYLYYSKDEFEITVLNYSHNANFMSRDFSDSIHLNGKSNAEFAKILKNDLIRKI